VFILTLFKGCGNYTKMHVNCICSKLYRSLLSCCFDIW